jgi:hypothetical protein
MNRNPSPNHELDHDPYWDLDEGTLTVIVKIRLNSEYFHQTADRCPKCEANCWEAEQPPIVFRGCACATMAFPPDVPLHDRWKPRTSSIACVEWIQTRIRKCLTSLGKS